MTGTPGGYAFANRFVNVVVRLPTGTTVRTAGRCGGMAYSVLDHAAADADVPHWPPPLFAPHPVPPDGHLVADHLRGRQLDSFRSLSALRFLTWSALPDGDVGPVRGVRTRTRRELPGVLRALAEGSPVVLGMVVARTPLRAGDNHQVVATGWVRQGDGVVLRLRDPNTPGREVTLAESPQGWQASNGRLWRGFFRHTYAPRTPPPLPSASRHPARRVRAGAPLVLVHVTTGRRLVVAGGRPDVRAAGTTTWTPAPVDAAGDGPLADGARVLLVATDGAAPGPDAPPYLTVLDGIPVIDGSPVAGGPLARDGARTPARDDARAVWRVVVEGGGTWREGARVRLVHLASGGLLDAGPHGLGATASLGAGTWWTVGSA